MQDRNGSNIVVNNRHEHGRGGGEAIRHDVHGRRGVLFKLNLEEQLLGQGIAEYPIAIIFVVVQKRGLMESFFQSPTR